MAAAGGPLRRCQRARPAPWRALADFGQQRPNGPHLGPRRSRHGGEDAAVCPPATPDNPGRGGSGRRAERLLHKFDATGVSSETMRGLRAVEVLERIGTPDAKAMLQTLAAGTPEARLTVEAQSSLKRLEGGLALR